MSSSISKVRTSVSELTSFIKEKCVANISEATNRGDISMDEINLRKVIGIVDLSVSQAFSLGFGNVESALKEHEKNIKKENKK